MVLAECMGGHLGIASGWFSNLELKSSVEVGLSRASRVFVHFSSFRNINTKLI